ncbi:MAG: hypothetical protein ACE5OQ_15535 [Woeseia sp.]
MTSRLGNLFRRRTAVQRGRQNPILLSAVDKSSEIYDQIPLSNFIGDDTRGMLARQLYLETNLICNSLEPVVTCRGKLAATMIKFASYQVLIIPPPPEEDVSGLRSQPGITGELKENILQIIDSDHQLCSELREITDSPTLDVVWEYLQRSYWQAYWFLETFNAARIELGDVKKERDWFLPFKHAACANCEHVYRREIELPPAFDEGIASDAATAYSIFTDIVISGAEDPELEWRDYHRGINIPLPDFG